MIVDMEPKRALKSWSIVGKIEPVQIGVFNETYRVKSAEGNFIFQKLHPLISADGPTDNYAAVTNFLRRNNYPAQEVMSTNEGKFLLKDGKRVWRLLREVPGFVYTAIKRPNQVREAGRALGRLHRLLKDFKRPLKKFLPMFQYGYHLRKLRGCAAKFSKDPRPEVREVASVLLKNLPKYFFPTKLPRRIIHTDPKISNFVFDKHDSVVAMIDFDTIQKLSPLYDIGDALRSVCGGSENTPRNTFDTERYRTFVSGYISASGNYLSAREKRLIPQAASLVILGLATRFLNDYIDDSYFGWDKTKYPSRRAHNLARAINQITLWQDFIKKTSAT